MTANFASVGLYLLGEVLIEVPGYSVLVSESGDFNLSNGDLAADRALLAFGQTSNATGGFLASNYFFGVAKSLDFFLRLYNFVADGASRALSVTSFGAGSSLAFDYNFLVAKGFDLLNSNDDLFADRALLASGGAFLGAGSGYSSDLNFSVSKLLNGLLLHGELFANRALLTSGEAFLSAGGFNSGNINFLVTKSGNFFLRLDYFVADGADNSFSLARLGAGGSNSFYLFFLMLARLDEIFFDLFSAADLAGIVDISLVSAYFKGSIPLVRRIGLDSLIIAICTLVGSLYGILAVGIGIIAVDLEVMRGRISRNFNALVNYFTATCANGLSSYASGLAGGFYVSSLGIMSEGFRCTFAGDNFIADIVLEGTIGVAANHLDSGSVLTISSNYFFADPLVTSLYRAGYILDVRESGAAGGGALVGNESGVLAISSLRILFASLIKDVLASCGELFVNESQATLITLCISFALSIASSCNVGIKFFSSDCKLMIVIEGNRSILEMYVANFALILCNTISLGNAIVLKDLLRYIRNMCSGIGIKESLLKSFSTYFTNNLILVTGGLASRSYILLSLRLVACNCSRIVREEHLVIAAILSTCKYDTSSSVTVSRYTNAGFKLMLSDRSAFNCYELTVYSAASSTNLTDFGGFAANYVRIGSSVLYIVVRKNIDFFRDVLLANYTKVGLGALLGAGCRNSGNAGSRLGVSRSNLVQTKILLAAFALIFANTIGHGDAVGLFNRVDKYGLVIIGVNRNLTTSIEFLAAKLASYSAFMTLFGAGSGNGFLSYSYVIEGLGARNIGNEVLRFANDTESENTSRIFTVSRLIDNVVSSCSQSIEIVTSCRISIFLNLGFSNSLLTYSAIVAFSFRIQTIGRNGGSASGSVINLFNSFGLGSSTNGASILHLAFLGASCSINHNASAPSVAKISSLYENVLDFTASSILANVLGIAIFSGLANRRLKERGGSFGPYMVRLIDFENSALLYVYAADRAYGVASQTGFSAGSSLVVLSGYSSMTGSGLGYNAFDVAIDNIILAFGAGDLKTGRIGAGRNIISGINKGMTLSFVFVTFQFYQIT